MQGGWGGQIGKMEIWGSASDLDYRVATAYLSGNAYLSGIFLQRAHLLVATLRKET